MKYLIGIDGGSQSTKVSVFDLHGRLISQGRQALRPLHQPEPLIAEHPEDDLWASTVAACRKAMAGFPHDRNDILGLGVCTIRCCRAELTADGELVSPVLNWMDQRLAEPWRETNGLAKFISTSSGYITHRLTGEFKDTAANYEGQWPLDKDTWQWSTEAPVIARFGLPREKLLDLLMPGEVAGRLTKVAAKACGLPPGIPVVVTANDKAVEAMGAGLHIAEPGTVLLSLGTYIGAMLPIKHNLPVSGHGFSNLGCEPNTYLRESVGIRHGMGTISWLVELLGNGLSETAAQAGLEPEELLNREATAICAGAEGLLTLPAWLADPDQPHQRGVMLGFHSGHTRAHLYRSHLEGIGLTMYNHIQSMCDELDVLLERIIVSGGGARSDLMMQIIADISGRPAWRNKISDAAGLGAAICASVATGANTSFAQAAKRMVDFDEPFQPNPQTHKFYADLNDRIYRELNQRTDPILRKLTP